MLQGMRAVHRVYSNRIREHSHIANDIRAVRFVNVKPDFVIRPQPGGKRIAPASNMQHGKRSDHRYYAAQMPSAIRVF